MLDLANRSQVSVPELDAHVCPGEGCGICGCVSERRTPSFVIEGYRIAPDYSLGGHEHSAPGLAVVLDGTFGVATDRETFRVGAGQAIVLPAGVVHWERSVAGARCLLVKLRTEALDGLERAAAETCILHSSELEAGGGRLARELDLADSDPLALDALAMELFLELQGLLDLPMLRSGRPRWVGRVATILAEEWRSPLSMADLSNRVGVSPCHLARSFRKVTGCTVGDFRRRHRLRAAARLLRRSDLSLVDIAYEVGFADQSHMTRQFRHFLGTTPARLRNRLDSLRDPSAGEEPLFGS